MSALTVSDEQATSTRAKVIQPAWVRALHWTNAFAMVLMIMSGWQIYNASPLFDFRFSSSITLGGWLGGALLWHFAAMWLLMVNGLIYLIAGFATGRFRKKLLPITPEGVITDTRAALTGKLSHADLSKYNQVQKLLYAGVIVVGIKRTGGAMEFNPPPEAVMRPGDELVVLGRTESIKALEKGVLA